jgi:hypothetical protein
MGIDLSKTNAKFKACIKESATDYRPVAGLQPQKPKPDKRGKKQNSQLEGSEERRGFRIQLICVRRRLLDEHDNLRASLKAVVDRITYRLGFDDDADPLLHWSYGQTRTMEHEGVVVLIEPL